MSLEEYRKALKSGKKAYRNSIMRNESPYLPVLQQILQGVTVVSQVSLGVVEIPMDQIAGTYYAGRQPTFAHGFLPLMPEDTEFAQKWIHLCDAHVSEGIHDPVKAYEFMNRFFIVEGHKRVSVLRYFGAASVRGTVTRIIPQLDDSLESKIYTEFLHFYDLTKINYLWFSKEGGFPALLERTEGNQPWDEEQRLRFRSFYAIFRTAFLEKIGSDAGLTIGDAMIIYLNIYDYASSVDKPLSVMREELGRLRNEMQNWSESSDINLILQPNERKSRIAPLLTSRLKVAFIYDKTPGASSWISAHDLGRKDLEAVLGDQIETVVMDNVGIGKQAEEAINQAIADRADLIFTASPRLLNASVKAALAYPKAKILNCSLNTSHPSIRTYYSRMYEAKFLMGMIAGSLTDDDKIGYLADYPIYSITANINAFALGAKMVNPRAKIYLHWTKTQEQDGREQFSRAGISYVSDRDMISMEDDPVSRYVGLYHSDGSTISNLALSFCYWGRLYEKIIRSYLSGSWKNDSSDTRAINYWWGMDSDIISLICSRSLPSGTAQLIQIMSDAIRSHRFAPFSGTIRTQDGQVLDDRTHPITPKEIITMDWLADNVIGSLPAFDQLLPEAQSLVRIQGIKKS